MVMKQHEQRKHKGWKRLRRPQNGTETTRQYTAQEIHSLAHTQSRVAGIIRPSTGDLHMPTGLVESEDGQQTNSPPRVMLVIITLALIFIAIITYLVSQMPKKD
jgi:hypothetical protein